MLKLDPHSEALLKQYRELRPTLEQLAKDAYSLMDGALRKQGIYVTAIDGIGENANGTNGGWVYTVNDEEVMVGCTEYVLEPGDVIQWSYITW